MLRSVLLLFRSHTIWPFQKSVSSLSFSLEFRLFFFPSHFFRFLPLFVCFLPVLVGLLMATERLRWPLCLPPSSSLRLSSLAESNHQLLMGLDLEWVLTF